MIYSRAVEINSREKIDTTENSDLEILENTTSNFNLFIAPYHKPRIRILRLMPLNERIWGMLWGEKREGGMG